MGRLQAIFLESANAGNERERNSSPSGAQQCSSEKLGRVSQNQREQDRAVRDSEQINRHDLN